MLRKVLSLEGTKRLGREQLQIIHGGGCPIAGCGSTDPKPDEPEDPFEE